MKAKGWCELGNEIEATNNMYGGKGNLGLFFGYDPVTISFNLVFVRNYVDPEPSHGDWGSEETKP